MKAKILLVDDRSELGSTSVPGTSNLSG